MGMDAGEVSGRFYDPDISVRSTPSARAADGSERVFPDEASAIAHIDSLPSGDTDFAVMPNPNGSGFVVRQLEQDFQPDTGYHGHLIRNHDSEAVAVVFRDRSGDMLQVQQRNQTIRPDGAGPVRERTELTDLGHGRRGLANIGDGDNGGTLGSQAADGSRTENWRIVSQ